MAKRSNGTGGGTGKTNGAVGRAVGGAGGKAAGPGFAGTPADRLVRLWRTADQRFGLLLDELLDAGRQAVIEAALGKLREDEQYNFLDEVEAFAESVQRTDQYGDLSTVTLFWLAAEVEGDLSEPPTIESIEEGLDNSGLLENAADTRLLPLWLDPEALSYLEAADRRAFLNHLLTSVDDAVAYAQRQDLVADAEAPSPRFVAVVGLVEESGDGLEGAGETLPDPLNLGIDNAPEAELDPEEEARVRAALDRFTEAVRGADRRVRRCEPIGGLNDLLDFTAEAEWQADSGLNELADFLDVASQETADGVVDVSVADTGEGLHIRAADGDGRTLDDRLFPLTGEAVDAAMDLLKRRCRRVSAD